VETTDINRICDTGIQPADGAQTAVKDTVRSEALQGKTASVRFSKDKENSKIQQDQTIAQTQQDGKF
jgi:hypothetical protein